MSLAATTFNPTERRLPTKDLMPAAYESELKEAALDGVSATVILSMNTNAAAEAISPELNGPLR